MTTGTSENRGAMERRGVRILDTFAEAFDMRAARVIVTAKTAAWARTAVQTMTGFATSVIGCKVEAALEAELQAGETPDGRPGASALLFAFDAEGLSQRLLDRVGQTILTCPTTACFDGVCAVTVWLKPDTTYENVATPSVRTQARRRCVQRAICSENLKSA